MEAGHSPRRRALILAGAGLLLVALGRAGGQVAPAGPAVQAASTTEDVAARVRDAVESERRLERLNALRSEVAPAQLLDACVTLLQEATQPLSLPARLQVLQMLSTWRSAAGARTLEQDKVLADILAVELADPAHFGTGRDCVPLLPPELREPLVPLLVAQLEDPDPARVLDLIRVLERIGPQAAAAAPRLRELLLQPDLLPAFGPQATTDTIFARGTPLQARTSNAGLARKAAAEARISISGDPGVDADLLPQLDAEGRKILGTVLSIVAAQTGGTFGRDEAGAQALATLMLDDMESSPLEPKEDIRWYALMALSSDGVGEPARSRCLEMLGKLARDSDAQLAGPASKLLNLPESPCVVSEPPAADARQSVIFRPRSYLLDACETPDGLLAVTFTEHPKYKAWPPATSASKLHLWDVRSGKRVAEILGVRRPSRVVRFSSDGARLFVGCLEAEDGSQLDLAIRQCDGSLLRIRVPDSSPTLVASTFLSDGRVALADDSGAISVWDFDQRREVATTTIAPVHARCLAASPHDARLLVGGDDGRVHLISLEGSTLQETAVFGDPQPDPEHAARARKFNPKATDIPYLTALAWLPDGGTALCGDSLGGLVLRDLRDGHVVRDLPRTPAGVDSLAISADGTRTLSGSYGTWTQGARMDPLDFSVRLFDLCDGSEITRFSGMQQFADRVAFVDGDRAVLALGTTVLRVWTIEPPAR